MPTQSSPAAARTARTTSSRKRVPTRHSSSRRFSSGSMNCSIRYTVGSRDLDAVEACFRGQLRGARVAGDHLPDLVGRECPRLGLGSAGSAPPKGRQGRRARRRGESARGRRGRAGPKRRVPCGCTACRNRAVALDDLREVAASVCGVSRPEGWTARRLEHDQARHRRGPAPRGRRRKSSVGRWFLDERGLVRRRDDAVRSSTGTERQRAEQVRESPAISRRAQSRAARQR
jgi:hypothetical protein